MTSWTPTFNMVHWKPSFERTMLPTFHFCHLAMKNSCVVFFISFICAFIFEEMGGNLSQQDAQLYTHNSGKFQKKRFDVRCHPTLLFYLFWFVEFLDPWVNIALMRTSIIWMISDIKKTFLNIAWKRSVAPWHIELPD